MRRQIRPPPSSPGLTGRPSIPECPRSSRTLWNTGSPAFAGDDVNMGCDDPLGRRVGSTSELPEQRVAAGNLDLAGGRLEVELLDRAVLDQHRVALGADAEAVAGGVELHADRLGEFVVAVGEEGRFVALVG